MSLQMLSFRDLAGGVAASLLLTMALAAPASAHNGAAASASACQLTVGPYRMNLTGYQPGQGSNQEFCTSLPTTGATILVLEYLNDELRDLEVDIRIVRAASAVAGELAGATVHQIAPRKYARGQLTLRCDLSEAGQFVAIVTVRKDAEQYSAEIPLVVGAQTGVTPARAAVLDLDSPLGAPLLALGLAGLVWLARTPRGTRGGRTLAPRRAVVRRSLHRRR